MSVIKSLKKSNVILIAIILILLVIIAMLLINNNIDNVVKSNESNFKENIVNSNALTMMYETEAGSGEYQVSSDTTWPQEGYIFNEILSSCENGSTLVWDDENKKVVMQANTSDKCYVYFDKEPDVVYLADYVISQYTNDGDNGLYYHDGMGSYTNADQEAGDNSYRYAGANPNNYVCFGSDEESCPADNLYRIIGLFNYSREYRVKLIKATIYGSYLWDDNAKTWNETTKPNIYTTLNETYYNTLENEWQNLIAETTWQVGGMDRNDSYTAKQYYNVEVGSGQTGYEETMKIGLMYVSDYGYAAAPSNWTTELYNYSATNANWAYLGATEWSISRCWQNDYGVFLVGSNVSSSIDINMGRSRNTRPTFYLNSDVQYISGTGTQSDPFRIA